MLENRDNLWVSNEIWFFQPKSGLIYIENNMTGKVLGLTNDSIVSLEDYVVGDAQQLWIKGEPTVEGYYTLENSGVPMVLTAVSKMMNNVSESSLEVKGKHNTELDNNNQKYKSIYRLFTFFYLFTHRSLDPANRRRTFD